jgi:hypothetical protein
MIYFLIFIGLGPELKIDHVFQPLAPPCPLNLLQEDKEWTKVGSKWKCKAGTYIVAYYAKWLLIKHLKEVHGSVAKKAKPKKPSTFERGLRHQDHVKMNVRNLGNAMPCKGGMIKRLLFRAHAKAHYEWDKVVIVTKQCHRPKNQLWSK